MKRVWDPLLAVFARMAGCRWAWDDEKNSSVFAHPLAPFPLSTAITA